MYFKRPIKSVANMTMFGALEPHARNCLRAAALLAEAAGASRARELAAWYLAQLEANGLTVQAPGDKLAGELAAIGATMAAEWSAATGADGAAIMAALEAGHTNQGPVADDIRASATGSIARSKEG